MSGQIIHMTPSMSCIFEVADLAVASPATVSRCGMVYQQPESLGWRCMVVSWLNTLPPGFDDKARKRLETLVDWLVPPALRVVRSECTQYVPSADSAMLRNLLSLFDALLLDCGDSFADAKRVEELGAARAAALVEGLFLFALIWSIGASVDVAGRACFDRFLRKTCKENPSYKLTSQVPPKGLVHDYVFSRETGRWTHWSETLSPYYRVPTEVTSFQQILVPTPDSARYKFLLDTLVRAKKPVLFVGPTGTAKSATVMDMLHGLEKDRYDSLVIHFSAQTSANQTQALVDDKLDRRRRGVYGPSAGKQCVIFIDDVSATTQMCARARGGFRG